MNMAKKTTDKEQNKTARLNVALDVDTFDYIKTIGAARFGSMTGYIEELVRRDREAWSDNEKALREILAKK